VNDDTDTESPDKNDLEKVLHCCQVLLFMINNLDLDKKLTLDEVGVISIIAQVVDTLVRKHGLKEDRDREAPFGETRR
jgi:hypothetical protein